MRIQELLTESLTFNPCDLTTKQDSETGEDYSYYSGERWEEPGPNVECSWCDGTGRDDDKYPCMGCKGTGWQKSTTSTAPELNVSNRNATTVLKILLGDSSGEIDEPVGAIKNSDLPQVMRRLLTIKNRESQQQRYTSEPSTLKQPGRATMISGGTSAKQVSSYIDRLIELVKFCQDENADLCWG